MKANTKRLISVFLAVVMMVTALPLTALQVSAAEGDTPEVEILDYELDGDQFTVSAQMTLSGGAIECYGFAYSINGKTTKYDLTYDEIGKWEEFSTTLTVSPGDTIWFEAIVRNEYGLEGKDDDSFDVPEEEFDVSDDYFYFDAEGGEEEFEVYATSDYTISDDQNWISVSPKSGSSDNTITITVEENLTDEEREGEIVVYHEGKDEEIYITIEQDAGSIEAGFDFSDFWYSDEIELGDDLEWGGYIELDEDDWEIVSISISIKHPNGSAIYYRETDVWNWEFDMEDIHDGNIPTNETAPKGEHPDGDDGYYTVSDFAIDKPGTYKLFVNVYAENAYMSDFDKREYEFEVLPAPVLEIPEADLTVSPVDIKLGESFTYNGSTYGNDYELNTVSIGIAYFRSESDYQQYISDPDKYSSLCADGVYIRYTDLNTSSKTVSGTIKTGAGCYVDGYTLDGNDEYIPYTMYLINEGVYLVTLNVWSEEYGILVKDKMAVYVTKSSSETVGDINGDGEITNKDRFLLNRYFAGISGYTNIDTSVADINGDGMVNQSDADYLTNHLAGVKGYEKLPEINVEVPDDDDNTCAHKNCNAVYAGKTVFVNNTIKNDGIHSYYHIWYSICKECGENLGEFQGDDDAIKGALEKKSCTYNSDGVCSCGAIDTTGYSSWTAKNITGKKISVYDTPYSTDGSYGKIFKDESVKVLGNKAGRYLIEYAVTGTTAKKQGYVNASSIKSTAQYTIDFDFEIVTLPATGKTVLLVPYKGYATYVIKDNQGNKISPSSLSGFTIESGNKLTLTSDKYTINGSNTGVGGLNVYFRDSSGQMVIIDTPDFCAVVGTDQKSGNYNNRFLSSEVDAIMLAIDMFMSSNVPLPSMTDWTTWDGFLYYVETFKDNIVGFFAGAISGTTGEQRESAAVIGKFIEWYIEENEKEVALSTDGAVWANAFSSLMNEFLTLESKGIDIHEFPSDVQDAFNTVKSLKNAVKDSKSLVEGLKAFGTLIDSDVLPLNIVRSALNNNGVTLSWFKGELASLIKLDILQNPMDFAQLGVDAAATTFEVMAYVFADYSANLEVLRNIRSSLDASNEQDKTIIGALEILESEYTNKFKTSLGKVANFAMELVVDGVIGLCPVADVFLTVAETVIGVGTTVKEEADLILFQYFMYAFMGTIEFDSTVFVNGQITTPYESARQHAKLYFYMALYANRISLDVDEAVSIDKAVIKSNINRINDAIEKFDYYFN